MEASTYLINNHIYSVKDKKLTEDYNAAKQHFDNQVSEARGINQTVTEGKRLIAEAITSKNVITEPDATFETMANNVLAIKSQLGYTPPAQAGTNNKPYKNFICEYPYRKYTAVREAGFYMNLINMPVNYLIPSNIASTLSVISRVKRLNDNWNGVYVVGNKSSNHSENFVIQFVSDTQLAYHSVRKPSGSSSSYITDTRLITIPSINSWTELVLEFKYNKDENGVINTSINIAQVLDDKIQEFIEVQSDSNLADLLWSFSESSNSLLFLSSEYTEYEVAPSAVNCNDMAFVVNNKIYSGNTSLYEFPEDFTID